MPVSFEWEPEESFRLMLWDCEDESEKGYTRSFKERKSSGSQLHQQAVHEIFSRIASKKYTLEKDEYLRPYLTEPRAFAGISHSGRWVACGIHPEMPCGLDVECFHPRLLRVAERFLMPAEKAKIPSDDPISMLTLAWSAKETLYKWYGKRRLESKDILLELPEVFLESGNFAGRVIAPHYEYLLKVHYRQLPGAVLTAVCGKW